MSLKMFSNRKEQVMDELGWENYHGNFRVVEKQVAMRKIAESTKIISHSLPEEGKVLDAGCGSGGFLVSFKGCKSNTFFGTDFSLSALNTLKVYDASQLLVKSDVLNLPFSDSSFDAVVSAGVVEHFEEGPVKAFRECYRVLKPGGQLICSVPYANVIRHIMYSAYIVSYRFLFGKVRNFTEYRYTRLEMVNFCQKAGFLVKDTFYVDLEPNNFSFFWFVDFGSCFKKKKTGLPFELNIAGKLIKTILKPFPMLQAGGILLICKKK